MKKEDVLATLQHIADSDEKCAADVIYALTLLSSNVSSMLNSVTKEMHESIDAGNYDVAELTAFCKNITELNDQISECIQSLMKTSVNVQKIVKSEKVPSPAIDYSKYSVDSMEKHLLNEDFEFKRVCAFELYGKKYPCDSWKGLLLKLCTLLYKENPAKMKSFVNNPKFKTKKNSKFSYSLILTEQGAVRNTLIPGAEGLYVLTNLSANDHSKQVKLILKEYGIPVEEFPVYLRADYTELHT